MSRVYALASLYPLKRLFRAALKYAPHASLEQSARWFDRIPTQARAGCSALPLHMGWRALESNLRPAVEAAYTSLAAQLRTR